MDLFQRRLSGHARVWFESLTPTPVVYHELKGIFRQQFWSATSQRKIRNEIFRPYQYRSSTGIAAHAMEWIAKAKYLTPPIDPFDIVGIIIQHYPSTLGMAIRGRCPKTTNELLAILTEFEESTSFCDQSDSRSTDNRLRNRQNYHEQEHFSERRGQQSNNNQRQNHRGRFNQNTPQQGVFFCILCN